MSRDCTFMVYTILYIHYILMHVLTGDINNTHQNTAPIVDKRDTGDLYIFIHRRTFVYSCVHFLFLNLYKHLAVFSVCIL